MEFIHVKLQRDSWMQPVTRIHTPEEAVQAVADMIKDVAKEMLISINLATDGSVINASICSIGSINQSVVSVAEIVRIAVLSGGASLILIHNHPSGSCNPSMADKEMTKKVALACRFMDLELLDHIIVGADSIHSLKEEEDSCFCFETGELKQLIAEGEGENDK